MSSWVRTLWKPWIFQTYKQLLKWLLTGRIQGYTPRGLRISRAYFAFTFFTVRPEISANRPVSTTLRPCLFLASILPSVPNSEFLLYIQPAWNKHFCNSLPTWFKIHSSTQLAFEWAKNNIMHAEYVKLKDGYATINRKVLLLTI